MKDDTIRKRWPDLGRERLITDAQIKTQAARTAIMKVIHWSKDVLCEQCEKHQAISTQRYCVHCRPIIIKELEACGCLQKLGSARCGQS